MDSYKRIVKENSLIYIILLLSFAIEVLVQVLVSPYQNASERYFTYFFIPLLYFLLCSFMNGIILPLTSFRFSILFSENRERAFKRINRYINLNGILFMFLSMGVILCTPYSKEGIKAFAKVNLEGVNVQFSLIVLQCMALFTVAQVGLNISFVFLNKGILKGMLNVMALLLLSSMLIIGSLYFDLANEALFWLGVGATISAYCALQNNRHFRTCEF